MQCDGRIETFHKILKSGCKADASKLRAAERIVNLIAVFCILSWRAFWMTMMNRVEPTASPTLALTTVDARAGSAHPRQGRQTGRVKLLLRLTSRRLPGWAAISHTRKILRPAMPSCGAWVSRLTDSELGFVTTGRRTRSCSGGGKNFGLRGGCRTGEG